MASQNRTLLQCLSYHIKNLLSKSPGALGVCDMIIVTIPVTKFSKALVTRRARTASDQSKFFERGWENFCSQSHSLVRKDLMSFRTAISKTKISLSNFLSLAVPARQGTSQSFLKGLGKTFVHKSFPKSFSENHSMGQVLTLNFYYLFHFHEPPMS